MFSAVLPRRPEARIVALYFVVFAALLAAGNLATHLLTVQAYGHRWPDHPVVSVLSRWDTGWYFHIAEDGYFYDGPGRQAATAFFPAYPAAMRIVGFAVRDSILAGITVTVTSALGASVLLYRWAAARLGRGAAGWTVALLFLYPFSYFLFGVVYSDALFLVSAVGAFVLLERDRPLLAGVAGAVACAGRPVGLAVLIGLAAVALQRRGSIRRLRPKDARVLVAYLWWRFDEPLAFTKVQTAEGWNRKVDLEVIAKLDFYRRWRGFGITLVNGMLTLQGALSVFAVAMLPAVWKRLGWGYAVYTAAVIGIPLATSSDFLAMGRYLLPAFPVFAVAGQWLADRRSWLQVAVLAANGAMLVWLMTLWSRWYLLA